MIEKDPDLVERRRGQKIASDIAERFGSLLENTNIIPWEADPATFQFTYVGTQAERQLGYPIKDWYRQDFWHNHIHPDDREQALLTCWTSLERGEDNDFEYRMIAADGRIVWFRDIVSVVMDDNGPTALRGVLINCTNRRATEAALIESEQKYRALVECASDAFFLHDLSGRFVEVNNAACQSLGYSREELLSLNVTDIEVSLSPEAVGKICSQMSVSQAATVAGQHRRKDGTSFPVEIRVSAYELDNQMYFLALARDISERLRTEEVTRLHQAELAHVARVSTMGEMATGLAHELNQPLTAAMNFIDGCLLRLESGETISPTIVDALTKASDETHRAGDIIRRLRQLVGKVDRKVEVVNVNEAINAVAEMMKSEIQLRQIDLKLDLEQANPIVAGDPILLQQVFLNLIRNGLEALESPETSDRLLTIKTSAPNGKVKVAVSDTGPGVAPETSKHLFEAFFTSKDGGLGVGLSICQSIIESHGGKIWFEPSDSQGATFNILLPSPPQPA